MCPNPKDGPDPWCNDNTEYLLCKAEIKKDLITATAAISALGTFMMGALANLYVEARRERVAGNANTVLTAPLESLLAWV